MCVVCYENGIHCQASLYNYTNLYKISNKTKPLTYHYPIEINLEEDDVSIRAGRAQQLYFDGCLSDGLSGQIHRSAQHDCASLMMTGGTQSTQHDCVSLMMTGGTQSQHSMIVPH